VLDSVSFPECVARTLPSTSLRASLSASVVGKSAYLYSGLLADKSAPPRTVPLQGKRLKLAEVMERVKPGLMLFPILHGQPVLTSEHPV